MMINLTLFSFRFYDEKEIELYNRRETNYVAYLTVVH